jgi:hypothetical protein
LLSVDELIAAAGRLVDGQKPDVLLANSSRVGTAHHFLGDVQSGDWWAMPTLLLAEPVGSCTDLVATVIRPLKRLYGDRFSVGPYVALLDPERALQAFGGTGPAAFSAKVTYLFKMQQHEADVVAVNKIDLLSKERQDELLQLVKRNFPQAQVVMVSARTGEGFDRLIELIETPAAAQHHAAEVDYDIYAEGEARLGWLNAEVELKANRLFDGDATLLAILDDIQDRLRRVEVEPAHVKMTLRSGDAIAIANLVGSRHAPELSRASGMQIESGRLLINARVEGTPPILREQIETAVAQVAASEGLEFIFVALDSFSPGRPQPSHRDVIDGC